MENKKIKLIVIEDSADDAILIKRKLENSTRTQFLITAVKTLKEGLDFITAEQPDLVISDLGLPDSHGLDTVNRILAEAPHIPLVVLSGIDDESVAIKAVQAGAQDYLVKGQIENPQLERSLHYSIERARLQKEIEEHNCEIINFQANLYKVLDKNADAILVIDKNNKILFSNPAAGLLMGRTQRDLLKDKFNYELIPGKTLEIEIEQPSKEKKTADMSVVDIDWEGQPASLVSIHEITQRKQMEQAVAESEEKFSKVFQHSPEVILITDIDDGTIIDANETFIRLTGYFRHEIIGQKITGLGIWADTKDREYMVKVFREKKIVSDLECKMRMKDGEIRTWLLSGEVINIRGHLRILSVIIDITERKKTEDMLRLSDVALKSIREGVIAMDNDRKITLWNDICEQMLGYKASEAIGKPASDVIVMVEEYKGQNEKREERLVKNGFDREEQIYRTPRGDIPVDVQVQKIENEGKQYGWITLVSDITARKKAEEALKRSEEKYRELVNTSNDTIVSIDCHMKFILWNTGAEKLFGYKREEMIGQSIMTIFPGHVHKKVARELMHLKASGASNSLNNIFETYVMKRDCSLAPVDVSISARKAGNNLILTAIMRDITLRKEAEAKLRQIDQMKSEFLSNVSHELRTPLQSISGFTKLLMNGDVPDKATQQEFLQIIDQETVHLGNLINGLLDMSRLEVGRFQIHRQPVKIRDTIIESLRMFESLARQKNIKLSEEISEKIPEMYLDNERIRQVIINLVGNAIKFSDPGGSVKVNAGTKDNELVFQVADHGTGIREENMKHLFERFYREEGETVRGGTGLGLYISKQIIEAHNGHIRAESKAGKGSTFTFTLPLNSKGGSDHG